MDRLCTAHETRSKDDDTMRRSGIGCGRLFYAKNCKLQMCEHMLWKFTVVSGDYGCTKCAAELNETVRFKLARS